MAAAARRARRIARRPSRARPRAASRGRFRWGSSRACCSRHARRARSRRPARARARGPAKTPSASEWSPPSTTTRSPARAACSTASATSPATADDRVEVLRARDRRRSVASARGTADVAAIVDRVADRPQPLGEPGIADRGRPHVDAAPALAEVERHADQRDPPLAAHAGSGVGSSAASAADDVGGARHERDRQACRRRHAGARCLRPRCTSSAPPAQSHSFRPCS